MIFTFFYWPAGQIMYWAATLRMPGRGGSNQVGLENIEAIISDPVYWDSVVRSVVFAL